MSPIVTQLLTLVAAVVLPICVLIVFLAVAYGRRALFKDGDTALPAAGLPVILLEGLAIVLILSWSLSARRRKKTVVEAGADVVILVHGASSDHTCLTRWRTALEERGVRCLAPDHGLWIRELENHTQRVASFVDDVIERDPTVRLHFVCHSMGGVIVRQLLTNRPSLRALTASVTTVASPHEGSAGGAGIPFGPVRRLTRGSPLFAELPPLRTLVPHARRTTIASSVDAIVYPPSTCHDAGDPEAQVIDVTGIGHAALLSSHNIASRIADLVVEAAVQKGTRDAGGMARTSGQRLS